jgi:hypothetical protein
MFCGASCAAKSPALLVAAGLLRQYVHVLLRNRDDPSPRPCGHSPAAPAMLGTANDAGCPLISPSMDCGIVWLMLVIHLEQQLIAIQSEQLLAQRSSFQRKLESILTCLFSFSARRARQQSKELDSSFRWNDKLKKIA